MFFRKLKICYLWQRETQVPKINLAGGWLRNAGFEIGKSVKVEVTANKIVITSEN